METINSPQTIHVISGRHALKDDLTRQLVSSLDGKKQYFEAIESYSFLLPSPTVIIIDCQQYFLNKCLDICLHLERQNPPPSISIRYVAITDNMNYQDQLKATDLSHFCFINSKSNYSECKNQLDEFLGSKSIQLTSDDAVKLALIDDDNKYYSAEHALDQFSPAQLTHIVDPSTLFDDDSMKQVSLIALNMGKHKCDTLKLVKAINNNPRLSSKPLLLYGESADLDLIIEQNLDYNHFLTLPVSAHRFHSTVISMLTKRKYYNNSQELQQLKQVQFQTQNAIDSHALVSKTNCSGVITYANQKLCQVSQYKESELLGKTHTIINSGYHDKEFFKKMWKKISSGEIWHGTICNRKKRGGLYWVKSTICPVPAQLGKGFDYISIRTEVTDQVIMSERIKLSQTFANIGTWDWDIETNKIFWSDRMGNLLGYDSNIQNISFQLSMERVHQDDKDLVTNSIRNCIDGRADFSVEHRIVLPNGEIRWVLQKGNVIRSNKGKALHMLGVVHDITQSKQFEQQLLLGKESAEKANKEKSIFLSSMSHELRTPMNAIIGFAQLLQMDEVWPPSIPQMDSITEILGASTHLLELINEVLNLSEIESGNINLSICSVDLCETVSACISLTRSLIAEKNIQLELYLGNKKIDIGQLGNFTIYVRADLVRLRQVILNLLSNAIKYNKNYGTVKISLQRNINSSVSIDVEDTGIGIETDKQNLLFQPFNRLGAENSNIEGTGIGLTITKQLVELMGGCISFTSELGIGTTFSLSIPIEERRKSPRHKSLTQAPSKRKENIVKQCKEYPNVKKILFVEDNAANLRLISQLVSQLPNTQLFTACNAEKGLSLAKQHTLDLVLLDINLPGISGLEAMQTLKKQKSMYAVPIAAISASAMPEQIQTGLDAGFDRYITKPIDTIQFKYEIDQLLHHKKVS